MITLAKTLIVNREQDCFTARWADSQTLHRRWRETPPADEIQGLQRAGCRVVRADLGESLEVLEPVDILAGALAYAVELAAQATGMDYGQVKASVIEMALKEDMKLKALSADMCGELEAILG